MCESLIHFGADQVIYVDHKALEIYLTEAYSQALTKVIKDQNQKLF